MKKWGKKREKREKTDRQRIKKKKERNEGRGGWEGDSKIKGMKEERMNE